MHETGNSMDPSGIADVIGRVAERLRERGLLNGQPQAVKEEVCDVCGGTGWLKVDKALLPCDCFSPQLVQRYLQRSGLQPQERAYHADYAWDLPGKGGLQRVAKEALESDFTGIYALHGDPGVGKSGVMKALVAATCRGGFPAYYTLAEEMLDEIRNTYSGAEGESTAAAMDRFLGYRLLAVDEIDRISGTEWATSTLMSILNKRYTRRHEQATIIATNAAIEELPQYLVSRLRDGLTVIVGGEDLRGRHG